MYACIYALHACMQSNNAIILHVGQFTISNYINEHCLYTLSKRTSTNKLLSTRYQKGEPEAKLTKFPTN